MSTVEFSFKGTREDLTVILVGLVTQMGVTHQRLLPATPVTPATLEPLAQDPVYPTPVPGGPPGVAASSPDTGEPSVGYIPDSFDFGALPLKEEAWAKFVALVQLWLINFDVGVDEEGRPALEQPDRLTALKSLGEGQWPIHILRWCAHYGSMQAAVFAILGELGWPEGETRDPTPEEVLARIAFTEKVTANITQVANGVFPDIIGFYDHSTRWKRRLT